NIQRLVQSGVRNLLLISLPNIGCSPFARSVDLMRQLFKISDTHNRLLKDMFLKMKHSHPNVHWIYFDVMPIWQQAMQRSKTFDLNHLQEACLQFTPKKNKNTLSTRTVTTKCEGYMFFDQLHPTTWVHALLADSFLKEIQLIFH
ncbi:MAG TPA: SGNH/GDSL hydrolase family protein, partial [Legionellaceae bacterium]|nr:SGNH/GDSL hydrolase family protein [Legionellaceae bacterium]